MIAETMTRDEWLKARHNGVGASEAAAVLGISPWQTPLGLYLQKIGDVPDTPATPRMEWGLKLERLIAEEFATTSGISLEKGPPLLQAHPWMLASLDYWVPGERVVEIKTVSPFAADGFGEDGTAEIPAHYALQVQQQMACANVPHATLVALMLGTYKTHVYEVPRNDEVISQLSEAEREFMARVARRDPPLPDFAHPSTAEILAMLEPIPGEVCILNAGHLALVDEYQELGELERETKAKREQIKAKLLHSMGKAEEGDLPDGRTIRRKQTKVRGHFVDEFSYFRFSILKAKGK